MGMGHNEDGRAEERVDSGSRIPLASPITVITGTNPCMLISLYHVASNSKRNLT